MIGIGFYSSLFTMVVIVGLFIGNKYIKKITNNYYFYGIISIFFLTYFLAFRWLNDLSLFIEGQRYSISISKVFLLDMCPFLGVFIPLSLIFDKTKNVAKVVAPFGVVGAGITIFGQISTETLMNNQGNANNWVEYLFFNKLYFFMHFYILILSILILLNSKTFTIKSVIMSHMYAVLYFTYIIIFIYGWGVDTNATGLVAKDWIPGIGQYGVVSTLFNLSFPVAPIVCFILVWLWICIMMFIKNLLTFDKENIAKKEIYVKWILKKLKLYKI
ncbi:MAG: DUF5378 family protein [Metamycoplasmataceae bacterium]